MRSMSGRRTAVADVLLLLLALQQLHHQQLLLLVVVLIAAPQHGFAQVRVRIWQPPDLDTTNLTKPVRFWELIELRPTTAGGKPVTPSRRDTDSTVAVPSATTKFTVTTSTSSSITSSTATSTAPVTVPWQPQTTVDPCGETDPSALMETLKDSGIYNEIYMAPDIFTASRNFPDLGGKNFMKAKSRYHCDEKCERSSKLVRFVMTGDDAPDPPKEAERTWWDEDEWKRGGRSVLSPDVSRLHRRKELQMTVRNAMRELERLDHEDGDGEHAEKPPEQEEFDQFFTSALRSDSLFPPRRRRRSSPVRLTMKNSGTAQDILGTTIALECRNHHDDLESGYQLCSSCRAVRHLPRSYFPRILNEVICGESTCVKGDGRCAQRFLPMKILHNEGTDRCPKWRLVSIDLRTCCDCVIHSYSPFLRYIQQI
ncbi:hypothetical protein Q1695_010380 [Nippostrongylus brasiliensis]|nr:hypothetical protein Q1695_010380 [Nippostrongylus brasiliensis]